MGTAIGGNLARPEWQIIRIIISIINKATVRRHQIASMHAGSTGVPANRTLAANFGMDGNGLGHMLGLFIAAHPVIVNPAIAVRGNFVTIIKGAFNHRGMALHRHCHSKERDWQAAITEQIQHPPDPGA